MSAWNRFFNKLIIQYISFVYKTSKISFTGKSDLLFDPGMDAENYIISFWHGDSYCFYPLLKGRKQFILTTKDRRGDYITALCNHFGYSTIRISDNYDDGKQVIRIRKVLADAGGGNLVVTLDGPLGPYHEPKIFPLFLGLLLNQKVLSISPSVKYTIRLSRRWDNYMIPLPFNKLNFHFYEPLAIDRVDIKDHFLSKRQMIKDTLEKK